VVNFVLKSPRREEQLEIDDAIDRALELWPLLEKAEWNAAMKQANTKPSAKPAAKPSEVTAAPKISKETSA
jgi:PTH1 family peptidyl-tRNA hydrolase